MKSYFIILFILFSINAFSLDKNYLIKTGINSTRIKVGCHEKYKPKKDCKIKERYLQFELGLNLYGTVRINFIEDLTIDLSIGYSKKDNVNAIELQTNIGYNFSDTTLYGGILFAINTKDIAPINSAFLIGIDYNYKNFLIDFRFSQGFSKILDFYTKEGAPDIFFNVQQFSFMIGYIF